MAGGASPWRDLGVRFVSGAILAPVGLACVWAGGIVWALTLALGAIVLVAELAAMSRGRRGAWALPLGALYIGLAVVSLWRLRQGPHGLGDVLFLLLVVWAGDIGAYLVGRLVGGPRLAPALSPGKTWSGALGGLACSIAAGLAVRAGLAAPAAVPAGVLACVLGVAAQAGDLLESAVKRRYGAKDSGWIIPGHGGLLDRLDGLLLAAPVALAVRAAWGGALPFWR